ncbi:MAG TPA: DNA polymerase III subunit beta [Thermodesulfobacteriota bacterium]|nr:DNA polymerase III subunit beta [Thermodesulfobacteriota bacterium]
MNFDIEKKELLKGLLIVQSIAGRKTTLPILSHVLMELEDNDTLYLTGTDLETGVREGLAVNGRQRGKASVSAKKLYEIIRELPDETIHIEKKENHWVIIKCGKSTFNLAGLDPEEFPSLPSFKEEYFSKIPSHTLTEMIEKTVFAASNEESRYHLNGIFFVQAKQAGRDVLRMVATDGHRLALVHREGYRVRGIEKGIILPKKGVLELRKILGEKGAEEQIEVYFDGTHGFLRIVKSLMILRLIDGEFPEYEQVIPKENNKTVQVEREKIYACLRRISTMASDRSEGIKLSIKKNALEGSSFNQDFGDAREEVEVAYEGPPLEVGFNGRYLIEGLNVIDTNEVRVELKDEGSPAIMRPFSPEPPAGESGASTERTPSLLGLNDQLSIIMPMRI